MIDRPINKNASVGPSDAEGGPRLTYARLILLLTISQLADRAHVLNIARAVSERRQVQVNDGAVYVTLKRLQEAGLLHSTREMVVTDDRKTRELAVYRLTDAGHAALEQSKPFYADV